MYVIPWHTYVMTYICDSHIMWTWHHLRATDLPPAEPGPVSQGSPGHQTQPHPPAAGSHPGSGGQARHEAGQHQAPRPCHQAQEALVSKTRRSILGSDGMTLIRLLKLLFECSRSALIALLVFTDLERWRLTALDKLVLHRQTDVTRRHMSIFLIF